MKPQKAWEELAERVSHEQDSQKLTELTKELIEALDEQICRQPGHPGNDDELVTRKSA